MARIYFIYDDFTHKSGLDQGLEDQNRNVDYFTIKSYKYGSKISW
jgi:hypothetical protein